MTQFFAQNFDLWSGTQTKDSPFDENTSFWSTEVKSGGILADQYAIIVAPWGGNCVRARVRPGDFTNGPRGRCEWLTFNGWGESGITMNGLTSGVPRFADGDEIYIAIRNDPKFTAEPGDSQFIQIKPTGCLNHYNSPAFSLKYSGGMKQLRVATGGGIAPYDCSGVNVTTSDRQWGNFYADVGTVQPNKVNDYVVRIKLSSSGAGGFTVWARFLDETNPDNNVAYTKILEQTGIKLGWRLSGGTMPSHYVRGGLYCILDSNTYDTYQDNLKYGQSFDDVTAGPPPPTEPPTPVPVPPNSFGKTTVGGSNATASVDRKRVSKYNLDKTADVTKLVVYVGGSGTGSQVIRGVIYDDDGAGGNPGTLLGTTSEVSISSSQATAWVDLAFASVVRLTSGNYWLGFISGATGDVTRYYYDVAVDSLAHNADTYVGGATNPFGSLILDSRELSIYAVYNIVEAVGFNLAGVAAVGSEMRASLTGFSPPSARVVWVPTPNWFCPPRGVWREEIGGTLGAEVEWNQSTSKWDYIPRI